MSKRIAVSIRIEVESEGRTVTRIETTVLNTRRQLTLAQIADMADNEVSEALIWLEAEVEGETA